jgi:hypothetical protein
VPTAWIVKSWYDSRHTLFSMPAFLSGHPQIDSPGADILVTGMVEQMRAQTGVEVAVGLYGTAERPRFVVAAVADEPPGVDPLVVMGPGLEQGLLGTDLGVEGRLHTGEIVRWDADGTRYECAPLTMSSTTISQVLEASMCVWMDPSSFGVLVTVDPGVDGRTTIVQAHDAVIG